MRQGLFVASSNVLPTPPFISFFSMMKSTLSLKAGMISTMEVRAGEPERFTLVENIGPVRGRRAERKGNLGIILPDVSKDNFFSDMLSDGAYPRKTFSIGHANEKRYYMEARKIIK